LALLAAGCGGGDGQDETPPVAVPSSTAAPDPEAAVPDPAQSAADEAPPDSEPPDVAEERPDPNEPDVTAAPVATESPPAVQEPPGPPHVAELPWGNFVLAERIAAKLEAGERLNLVISLASVGDDGYAPRFEQGWSAAGEELAERYGVDVNARVIGPNSVDAEAQAATIASLVATGDIDCLAVEAAGLRLMTGAIDAAVDAGVPVVAVGGDSPDSKRFAFFGIDAYAAGYATGQSVGLWAADGGILMRRGGVLTGDAGEQRSFDLMRGFVDGFGEIHSGLEWANAPNDVESLGFEPFAVYNATEAWVLENVDADIVFHTDEGLEQLAAVMADQLLYGDMYAVGFHTSAAVADYIRERLVVAAVGENRAEQARLAGLACGDFLLGGDHRTGHVVVEPTAVTRDNVDDADWASAENQ
jgi:ribose transport system substrate-binding protein